MAASSDGSRPRRARKARPLPSGSTAELDAAEAIAASTGLPVCPAAAEAPAGVRLAVALAGLLPLPPTKVSNAGEPLNCAAEAATRDGVDVEAAGPCSRGEPAVTAGMPMAAPAACAAAAAARIRARAISFAASAAFSARAAAAVAARTAALPAPARACTRRVCASSKAACSCSCSSSSRSEVAYALTKPPTAAAAAVAGEPLFEPAAPAAGPAML